MGRLANLFEPARLRRWALVLVAIVVAAVGTLAMRAKITVDPARLEVEAALSALAGRPLRLVGEGSVRVLPWPAVRFFDVAVTDGDTTLARMDELDVFLDVAALLLGRIKPDELRLARPDIRVEPSRPDLAAAAAARWLATWRNTSLTIEMGRVALALPGGDEILDGLDARLSWPRPSANVDLRGAFRWRGEAVSIEAETPSPGTLVGGGGGTLMLRVGSGPFRLAFAGTGGLLSETRYDGSVDVDVVDAARFARWTGRPRSPDLLAGRFRLDGRMTADANGATLPTVRVELAGNKGEGALTWRWDQLRPRLAGTLAFADLDFAPERRRPLGLGWRALPFDAGLDGVDLDLRLSAPSMRLPGLVLTRVAAALHLAERRLHAEIGNAEYQEKPLSLVVRGTLDDTGLSAQVRGSGDELPLADLVRLADIPGVETGRASLAVEGETRCRDLGACFSALTGRVALDIRAMTVTGASPFADISRFHPIVPQTNGSRVTTTWQRVGADLRLAGPRVEIGRVEILGQAARFLYSGTGDLSTGGIDLTGHAYFPAFRPDPARPAANEVAVPMRIGGTLRRLEAMARDLPPGNGTPAPTVSP